MPLPPPSIILKTPSLLSLHLSDNMSCTTVLLIRDEVETGSVSAVVLILNRVLNKLTQFL